MQSFTYTIKNPQFDNLVFGIPGKADSIVEREGYALGYIERHEQPAWVQYIMTSEEVSRRAAKRAAFESMFASPRKLSPYEQAQMELKELGFYQSDQGSEQKESEKHESYFDIMKSVSQKGKDPIAKPNIPDTKGPVAEEKPEPSAPSMPRQVSVTPSFEPSESLFSFDANKRYMEEINRRYEAKMAEKRRLAEEKEKQAELERQKARQAELEREEAARKQAEELSKKKIEQKVIERPEPKIEKKKPSRGMDL